MKRQIHRRLQPVRTDARGFKSYTIYSLSRPGKSVQHTVSISFEDGTFYCTCEHHRFTGAFCKHLRRAWELERKHRESETC